MNKVNSNSYWQSSKSSKSANRYMMESQLYADVEFEIHDKYEPVAYLYAHKYILISRSPVFEAMFRSDVMENRPKNGMSQVIITDSDEFIFRELLNFMYCDEADINIQNVYELMEASKKYLLDELAERCTEFMAEHLDACNVINIINISVAYNEFDLADKCLKFICCHIHKVFKHESFLTISQAALEYVVGYDYLYAESEAWIFKECMRWATHQRVMAIANVDYSFDITASEEEELRKILGNIVYKIRFTNMDPTEFARDVCYEPILSYAEKLELYQHILTERKISIDSQFNTNDRYFKCTRFASIGFARQWWLCNRGMSDAIEFTTDTDINLIAIALFGGKSTTKHDVTAFLYVNESAEELSELDSVEQIMYSDGSQKLRPIYFDNPVLIKANKVHTMMVSIRGQLTYYGINGGAVVRSAGVTFNFNDSKRCLNRTSVRTGQIPQLVFTKIKNNRQT